MNNITVRSQAELDKLPIDYDGRIFVEFGTPYNRAVVNRNFKYAVVARGNSSVAARGNSSVAAWENSSVVAWENSSVEAWENSSVEAWENSSVAARGNSSVAAWENSSVVAWENSSVEAWENSSVVARGNSSVAARGNSSVAAWENSSVVAWENSSVEAWENSSVEAWENSSVAARGNSSVAAWENSSVVAWENSSVEAWENSSVVARGNSSVAARGNSSVVAWGNSQVLDTTYRHTVSVSGNARIVYNPRTAEEYIEHFGIEHNEKTAKLYKAVHKRNGRYVSDWDSGFEYVIGNKATASGLTTDVRDECGKGIHMAYKEWCVDYGREWKDLAILEVEVEIAGIVVPHSAPGKVRAKSVNVLREVPLNECGLLGKCVLKTMAL